MQDDERDQVSTTGLNPSLSILIDLGITMEPLIIMMSDRSRIKAVIAANGSHTKF